MWSPFRLEKRVGHLGGSHVFYLSSIEAFGMSIQGEGHQDNNFNGHLHMQVKDVINNAVNRYNYLITFYKFYFKQSTILFNNFCFSLNLTRHIFLYLLSSFHYLNRMYLNSCLAQSESLTELLPHKGIRVVSLVEEPFQFPQLL